MSRLVSIIIPCHNAERWLAATLDSALAQTWPAIEVIIVDDGSSDGSLAIARSRENARVQIITQTNAGAAAARNTGLRQAQGEVIQFLDADDLLAPDKIAGQMRRLEGESSRALASGPWASFTGDSANARFQAEPLWADFKPFECLLTAWSGAWMFPPLVWLTPRAVLDVAGPWREDLSLDDDGEYFCRVLLQADVVCFAESARSYYRRHNGPRVSRARGARAAQSSFLSNQSKEQLALAREDSPRVRHALACNWQRFEWEQLVDAPALARQAGQRSRALDPALPRPPGPALYSALAPLVGWRWARRSQLMAQSFLVR